MQKKSENVAHAEDGIRLKKLKNSEILRNSPATGRPMIDLLIEEPEISRSLDSAELTKLVNPANYLGLSGVMVDRVLSKRGGA
jgi:3-carboxy-cis,cis-muconate cycloisomerase